MKRWFINNKWILILCFLGLPIILSLLIIWLFDTILDIDLVEKFILISGYLFTASSLILVFILFKKFNVSDYKKSETSRIFLEKYAFDDLYSALKVIRDCVENYEFENLSVSCTTVRNIHNSLTAYEADIDLKAYRNEIKSVVNLVNKHGLSTISNANEVEKLKTMRKSNRRNIISKIDDLMWELDNRKRSRLNED